MAGARPAQGDFETVFRLEFGRVVAAVARQTGDVGLAEEVAQDALEAALARWPVEGVPAKPGAWLTTVARRRAVDRYRRDQALARKVGQLGTDRTVAGGPGPDPEAVSDEDEIADDLLRLMFTACHPVLSPAARCALTLRVLGGLTTAEIGRAYLSTEATVAQRIVRAKRTVAGAGVPFEVPVGADRTARLASVLEVIYLIFNEGYAATAGDDWMRPALCHEARRLARLLATLTPDEPEVLGLGALVDLQSSRLDARRGDGDAPVLLADQDRRRWDGLLIRRGLAALEAASAAATSRGVRPGPYQLQAAIAACHARALQVADTDWPAVAALYAKLARVAPSPVVELNRAVAVAMADGPAAGLELVDALAGDGRLAGYHLLAAVRGDLLARLDRHAEAARAFTDAAALTANASQRRLCEQRAAASVERARPDR